MFDLDKSPVRSDVECCDLLSPPLEDDEDVFAVCFELENLIHCLIIEILLIRFILLFLEASFVHKYGNIILVEFLKLAFKSFKIQIIIF